jgi:hypothetical protein
MRTAVLPRVIYSSWVTPIAIVGALVNDITCNAANGTTNNGSARFTITGVAATSTYSYTTAVLL